MSSGGPTIAGTVAGGMAAVVTVGHGRIVLLRRKKCKRIEHFA
jgi:hypothetical protein